MKLKENYALLQTENADFAAHVEKLQKSRCQLEMQLEVQSMHAAAARDELWETQTSLGRQFEAQLADETSNMNELRESQMRLQEECVNALAQVEAFQKSPPQRRAQILSS